ncbi:hypothetical protein IKG12_02625 [Candidatus Saccharibacteria bacterium]|nr:hypothetical protein [Candidatus Saccharibacteria bacterium]
MDKTKIFCNELYKDDSYFMELLGSEDKARQCDYRNAIIKELRHRKNANRNGAEPNSTVLLLRVLRYLCLMIGLVCPLIVFWLTLMFCRNVSAGNADRVLMLAVYAGILHVLSMTIYSIIDSIMRKLQCSADSALEPGQCNEFTKFVSEDAYLTLMAKKEALDEVIWNLGKP